MRQARVGSCFGGPLQTRLSVGRSQHEGENAVLRRCPQCTLCQLNKRPAVFHCIWLVFLTLISEYSIYLAVVLQGVRRVERSLGTAQLACKTKMNMAALSEGTIRLEVERG